MAVTPASLSVSVALPLLLIMLPLTSAVTTPSPSTRAPLNGQCTDPPGCSDVSAVCVSGTCTCNAGYFDSGGQCVQASSVTPGSLQVTSRDVGSVSLSWSALNVGSVASVSGYEVRRDGTLVASPTGLSQQVTGLSPNVQYSFQVVAKISYSGRTESSGAANVSGKPLSTEGQACSVDGDCGSSTYLVCPSGTCRCNNNYFWNSVCVLASSVSPGSLQVTRGAGSVSLSWTAPNVGSVARVSGYEVRRDGTLIHFPTGWSQQVTDLTPNVQYSFEVAAKISYRGRSETSGVATVNAKPLSTEGQACSVDGDCVSNTNLVCPSGTCRCINNYFWNSVTNVCVLATSVRPGSLQMSSSVGSVTLNWTAPSVGSGASLTGYEVRRDDSLIASPTGTSQQVTGLSPNVQYRFEVAAKISYSGRSETSGAATVSGKPLSTEGQGCSFLECGSNNNLICSSSICRCSSNYFWNSDRNSCIPASLMKPDDVRVRGPTDCLSLHWSPPSLGTAASATGYRVLWANGSVIGTTAAPPFPVCGLTPSLRYTFHVVALISYNGRTETSSPTAVMATAMTLEQEVCSRRAGCTTAASAGCDTCGCRTTYLWNGTSNVCVASSAASPDVSSWFPDSKSEAAERDSIAVIVLAVLCAILIVALLVLGLLFLRYRRRHGKARDPSYAQPASVPLPEDSQPYTELSAYRSPASARTTSK